MIGTVAGPTRRELWTVRAVLALMVVAFIAWAAWETWPRRVDPYKTLDAMALVSPGTPLDRLTSALPWLKCRKTPPGDSTRFDYQCVGESEGLTVFASTLASHLYSINAMRVGKGPLLGTWASAHLGTPSGSCANPEGGIVMRAAWWTSASRRVLFSTLLTQSEVLTEGVTFLPTEPDTSYCTSHLERGMSP